MNKKAQVTIYIFWFLAAVLIIVVAALIAPIGVLFNTEMFRAGEDILLQANESISKIQNQTIKDSWSATVTSAHAAADTNIDVLTDLFQYSWVIVLVLSAIVAFLFTRQLVEFQGGGFV